MNILLSDLYAKCDKCGGTGEFKQMNPPASQGSYGPVRWASTETCDICRGSGGILTESGKAIKEFMQLIERNTSLS